MDSNIFLILLVVFAVLVLIAFLVNFFIKKRNSFYRDLRSVAQIKGYGLKINPEKQTEYSLSGNYKGFNWEAEKVVKTTQEDTFPNISFFTLTGMNLSTDSKFILIKSKSVSGDMDFKNPVIKYFLDNFLGRELSDDLSKMKIIPFGETIEFRDKFILFSDKSSDPSKYINVEAEKFLLNDLSWCNENEFLFSMRNDRFFLKTTPPSNIEQLQQVILFGESIFEKEIR